METMILLLLLALTDKNDGLKESLNRFLRFYKENRDFIQTFAKTFSDLKTENADTAAPEPPQKESRPREEVGDLNILEEYLRRANA